MAAPINTAFDFIVPKYQFHSNQAYLVLDGHWQGEDDLKRSVADQRRVCDNTNLFPASGNDCGDENITQDYSLLQNGYASDGYWGFRRRLTPDRSPNVMFNTRAGLPPVPLPYTPPPNLGLTKRGAVQAPMLPNERPVMGAYCSPMQTCSLLQKMNNQVRYR